MDGQSEARQRRGEAMVREFGGVRTRTVDEHMFRVGASSFRLQLFTGAGLRPVAVATQTDGDGVSLMNRAERFVEAVWRRLCPDEPEPPLFIAHQLFGGKDWGFQHYGFAVIGPYAVASPPVWGPSLTVDKLHDLVGGPVDPTRGGFVEPVPPAEPQRRYEVAAVIALPRPDLDGDPACMPAGTPWRRRLVRQVVPDRTTRTCCSYHAADWAAASAAAVDALARVDAGPLDDDPEVDGEDARRFAAVEVLRAAGLDATTLTAAESLFLDPIQPTEAGSGITYVNGRHRAQAMLDAGVHRTVIGRWYEPVTGD